MSSATIDVEAIKSEIRSEVMNRKANACPIIVRLAWHASGTYEAKSGTGGSDGATMRFEPESTDGANNGLSIPRDMLEPIKQKHPEVSYADLWTLAGCAAIEFTGGPKIPFKFGRTDDADGARCPANGRLPDASQGAAHLRQVFHRMGFSDKEIVCLSGAHTLGSCHRVRSGFDGPWTRSPLKFDNMYFKHLLELKWTKKKWDGPEQFEDESGELMMLPTDICLTTDPGFLPYVKEYAASQELFFQDFAAVFGKLIALGAKQEATAKQSALDKASALFRKEAMHGATDAMKKAAKDADVHQVEASSGRTAMHKAAYWGHDHVLPFLINEYRIDVNAQDFNGDTAAHDAAKFGHVKVVQQLVSGGANLTIKNKDGLDVFSLAERYGKTKVLEVLRKGKM